MKSISNPSTVSQEMMRQSAQSAGKTTNKNLQQELGTITEVHKKLPMVKVSFRDGRQASGGDWIPVGHSVLDIVQRFGALRKDLRVMVVFSGETESGAIANIVGFEHEKIGIEISEKNESELGPVLLFPPGKG